VIRNGSETQIPTTEDRGGRKPPRDADLRIGYDGNIRRYADIECDFQLNDWPVMPFLGLKLGGDDDLH
jgi:hypothetical protein